MKVMQHVVEQVGAAIVVAQESEPTLYVQNDDIGICRIAHIKHRPTISRRTVDDDPSSIADVKSLKQNSEGECVGGDGESATIVEMRREWIKCQCRLRT